MTQEFGPVGAWVSRRDDPVDRAAVASAAFEQGYRALWLAGGLAPGAFGDIRTLLECSDPRLRIGTSVLNMWMESANTSREAFAELEQSHPGRFYLGLGVSHAPAIEGAGFGQFRRPLAMASAYLDDLLCGDEGVPSGRVLIGALGPRMLQLARGRTLGTLPYLVGVEHVRSSRQALGEEPVLAPVLMVAVHDDREEALAAARAHLTPYLALPSYTNNFVRMGFGPEHFDGEVSEALVDAVIAVGTVGDVRGRIAALHAAGADHVALQVIPGLGADQANVFKSLAPNR